MTDRYLQMLWRKAVLVMHENQCVFCGNKNIEQLECHHFIKRRHAILKHDVKNGFPLCKYSCHLEAHTKKGEQKLVDYMGKKRFEYLCKMEQKLKKDYLLENGLSKKEFENNIIEELKKRIIAENTKDFLNKE